VSRVVFIAVAKGNIQKRGDGLAWGCSLQFIYNYRCIYLFWNYEFKIQVCL